MPQRGHGEGSIGAGDAVVGGAGFQVRDGDGGVGNHAAGGSETVPESGAVAVTCA